MIQAASYIFVMLFSSCAAIDGFRNLTNSNEERSLDYIRERELLDKIAMEKERGCL